VVERDLGRGGIGIFGGVLLLVLLLAAGQLWHDLTMRSSSPISENM